MSRLALCVLVVIGRTFSVSIDNSLPENFLLGVSTSAYQTEGAWNESGKGLNIWDTFTHSHPEYIIDRSSGDVACDSYHKYKDDVQMVKELGVNFYKFSISWARILPRGHVNVINQQGIDHYNRVIDEMKNNNIEPMITMYHWDLPQLLQDMGGWANPVMAEYFEDYADLLFTNFGDRVKWWITINEPSTVAKGYALRKEYAPGVNSPGIGDYMALHTMLMAHANVYHLYNGKFRLTQQGKVGISLNGDWYEPVDNSEINVAAKDRFLQFVLGSYAHPIFSVEGDYPEIVKEKVAEKSKNQGFVRSRLPVLSEEEVSHIKGTSDFFGINHYTTNLVSHYERSEIDTDVLAQETKWEQSESTTFKPNFTGFRKILTWIKKEYNNPTMFITENGFFSQNGVNDMERATLYVGFMAEMLKAIKEDGCNIIGYSGWRLMDSFEWHFGYGKKFGLYFVNFSDPELRRIPKYSAHVISDIAHNHQLPLYLMKVTDIDEEISEIIDMPSTSTSVATDLPSTSVATDLPSTSTSAPVILPSTSVAARISINIFLKFCLFALGIFTVKI